MNDINKLNQITDSGENKSIKEEVIQTLHNLMREDDYYKKELEDISKDLFYCWSFSDLNQKIIENIDNSNFSNARKILRSLWLVVNNIISEKENKYTSNLIKEKNINEIDESFLNLSDTEKILITKQWHEKNNWENYSREKNFWCGWYWDFKDPSDCWSCVSSRTNLAKAWLRKLAKFKWDRCYSIPKEIIKDSVLSILDEQQKNERKEIWDFLSKKHAEINILEEELRTKEWLINFFNKYNDIWSYQKVKKERPEIAEYVESENIFNRMLKWVSLNKNENLGIFSLDESRINWTGPMTYWIKTTIRHDGKKQDFKYVYRDLDNLNWDYTWFNITYEILSKKETESEIEFTIAMYNDDKSKKKVYTANFDKKQNIISSLSDQEKIEFKKMFDQKCEETRDLSTRKNWIMRDWWRELPRESAEIVDKEIDFTTWKWAFIIKTQIDTWSNASMRNKQYGWRWYIVDINWDVKNVWYECAREADIWLMDFAISDPIIIDTKRRDLILNKTAKSLLEWKN